MAPPTLPTKLYKYRPFNVFCLRLLTHGEVSYSDPRSFNDPLDCNPTLEVDIDRSSMEFLCYATLRRTQTEDKAINIINNYRHLSSEHGNFRTDSTVDDDLKRMLAQRIMDELGEELGSRGVLSLSERWDSVLMWSHYADNHRGICIEFATDKLPHPFLQPVNYRAPRRIKASDLHKWKRGNSAEAERRVRETYYFAKAGPWRYEKEWRDIQDKSGIKNSNFSVTAIHFGLQCDQSVIQTVVKLLDRDRDVALFNTYPLEDSFRLKRRPVDRDEIESFGMRQPAALAFKDFFLTEETEISGEQGDPSG